MDLNSRVSILFDRDELKQNHHKTSHWINLAVVIIISSPLHVVIVADFSAYTSPTHG